MPCYDKKLEAVRPTMLVPNPAEEDSLRQVMEVDTVLATHEIADLLEKKQIDFNQIVVNNSSKAQSNGEVAAFLKASSEGSQINNLYNRQSNGYLEFIMRKAAKSIFNLPIKSDTPLEYSQGRNKDLREVTLKDDNGEVKLKFA